MNFTSNPTTNVPTLLAVIKAASVARIATLLWGSPGIGKTSLIRQIAAEDGRAFAEVMASLADPTDFAGMPVVTGDGVRMEALAWAKNMASNPDGGWVLLSEITTCSPDVQKALLRTALERWVGDTYLGDNVAIIADANPVELAVDGYDLAAPLANRFLHVTYRPALTDWMRGVMAGFPALSPETLNPLNAESLAVATGEVLGYLSTSPAAWNDADHLKAHELSHAWASPRTWVMAMQMLAQVTTEEAAHMAVAGLVGEGHAIEFLTWRRERDLPLPSDVLADPDSVDWASLRADQAWTTLAGAITYALSLGTVKAWREAWAPVVGADAAGRSDAAVFNAQTLLANPAKGADRPPAAAKKLLASLQRAGLVAAA